MNRYQTIPTTKTTSGRTIYRTVKYPEIPLNPNDIYVIANKGDRYDILANQYYSDSSLWWVISTANNNVTQNSLYLPEGTQIRIPSDVTLAIDNFEVINS
jgi:phage tail protein X